MKKIYIILFLLYSSFSFAQFNVGLKGGAAIPTGYNEEVVDAGLGGILNINYSFLGKTLDIYGVVSFYHFGYKDKTKDYTYEYNTVPVGLGIKYTFILEEINPFIFIEGNYFINRYKLNIDYGYFGSDEIITKENKPGFATGIGFTFNISPLLDIEFSGKYNRVNTKYISRAFVSVSSGFIINF